MESAGIPCRLIHLIRAVIGHTVFSVSDRKTGCIQPAVAFNKANTVNSTTVQPMSFNESRIVTNAVGILLFFVIKQCRCQNIAVGAPNITPVVFPCLNDIGNKICIVFGVRRHKGRNINSVFIGASVFQFSRKAAVAAIIGFKGFEIGFVGIQCAALRQCFIKCACPSLRIIIKLKIIHQLFRCKTFDLQPQYGCDKSIAGFPDANRRRINDAAFAKFLNKRFRHDGKVLFQIDGVNCDQP